MPPRLRALQRRHQYDSEIKRRADTSEKDIKQERLRIAKLVRSWKKEYGKRAEFLIESLAERIKNNG